MSYSFEMTLDSELFANNIKLKQNHYFKDNKFRRNTEVNVYYI